MAARRPRLAARRRAVGLTQESLAYRLGVDPSTVRRWERGDRSPGPAVRVALATALQLTCERLDDLVSMPDGQVDIGGALARDISDSARGGSQEAGADHPPATSRPAVTRLLDTVVVEAPTPTRVGWTEVEHVRATTRAVAASENRFGGGLSCQVAAAHLRWAGQLLEARATAEVRRATAEAVGNLAGVAAFSAFDAADHRAADRCFALALWCADESGSWQLRSNTLAEMARKAAYLGDVDEALELVELGQVRSDRLTATARAMLATLRAWLLARVGRHAEAEAEVDRADAHVAERDQAADPPWLCYYDAAEHHGSIGKVLIALTRVGGTPDRAVERLRAAIELQAAGYPRSRAFSRVRLAAVTMRTGDPREAVPVARQALTEAASLRSTRLVTELRDLAGAAAAHVHIGDVADLRHDLTRSWQPSGQPAWAS